MLFRQLSRRDAIWVMLGASFMHFYAALSPPNQPFCDSSIVINTHLDKYQDTSKVVQQIILTMTNKALPKP
jgi:hypothetical protein